MSHSLKHFVVRPHVLTLGLAALIGTGCAGGGALHTQTRPAAAVVSKSTRTDTRAPTATASVASSTATEGLVRATPPPVAESAEDAITATLRISNYLDWMYANDPDPSLLVNIVLPASEFDGLVRSDLEYLVAHHARAYDVGAHYRVHPVAGGHRGDVRVDITNSLAATRVVDSSGRVIKTVAYARGSHAVLSLVVYRGHWVISSVTRIVDPNTLVVLP